MSIGKALNQREQEWLDGFHTSSNGKQTALKDLPTPYLKNIINKYGSDHLTYMIQDEIDSRPAPEEEKEV